jgi:hypothetical protein
VGVGLGVLVGGIGVFVGLRVRVGLGVLVGGIGVFVGPCVRVGLGVLVGGIGVFVGACVRVGLEVLVGGIGDGGFVAVRVGRPGVFVETSVYVAVESGWLGFSWLAVGGNKYVSSKNGVGVLPNVETTFNVMAAAGVGVGVPLPVTGMRMGPAGLGTILSSICLARATAVLFILAEDKSCVLRACRSMAVGGVGLIPATKNIIQTIPAQRPSATKACAGTTYFFII